jgi:Xaa-Pro dipeptidase
MNRQRLQNMLDNLAAEGLTQMVICDPATIYYLTGQWVHPYERLLALLLRSDGGHQFFANSLFYVMDDPDAPLVRFSDTDDGVALIAAHTDHAKPLGIDKDWPARFLLHLMELGAATGYVNASACADRARACKDAAEQALMREASRINDLCMARFKALLHEGVTEREVADQIPRIYLEEGADGVSFAPIVGFGGNAADAHHEPDDTPLRPGDCVVLDVGCIKDGYCSDMTRTFFYKEVSDKHRQIYELVRRANEAAEALVRPGVRLCDLDAAARGLIAAEGYGPQFTHRLGHSIGFECHEAGDVSASNTDQARRDDLFHRAGHLSCGNIGVRIEDLVLVTKDGMECLNHYSKELEVLG